MSTRTPSSSSSRLMLTIGLCFLVALMEGWLAGCWQTVMGVSVF